MFRIPKFILRYLARIPKFILQYLARIPKSFWRKMARIPKFSHIVTLHKSITAASSLCKFRLLTDTVSQPAKIQALKKIKGESD